MIPKVVHIVFGLSADFGHRPFSLIHYVTIRSAIEQLKPDKVRFYYRFEPHGIWWERASKLVELVSVRPPTSIFGNRIGNYAHASDVLRMSILLAQGGIYLDSDVLVRKSFDDLLGNSFVMGKERGVGLCNAVMLSEPGAPFLANWFEEYRSFDTTDWNGHSVRLPATLAEWHPDQIKVLGEEAFFEPMHGHEGTAQLFVQKTQDFPTSYAHHLWESISWTRHQLATLEARDVMTGHGLFHHEARRYVEEFV